MLWWDGSQTAIHAHNYILPDKVTKSQHINNLH